MVAKGKAKYVIVRLQSVISGHPRVWLKERLADKFAGIFYDPAIGRETLYEETEHIKSKGKLLDSVKRKYGIDDSFAQAEAEAAKPQRRTK